MKRSVMIGRHLSDYDDFTRWDETIFERCLEAGFNPFGSGPTPIFERQPAEKAPMHAPSTGDDGGGEK